MLGLDIKKWYELICIKKFHNCIFLQIAICFKYIITKVSGQTCVLETVSVWPRRHLFVTGGSNKQMLNLFMNRRIQSANKELLPNKTKLSFLASTSVTDSSPTKSLFPSWIRSLATFWIISLATLPETGPIALPCWKSRTIFLGRTKRRGKSSVRSSVRNLVIVIYQVVSSCEQDLSMWNTSKQNCSIKSCSKEHCIKEQSRTSWYMIQTKYWNIIYITCISVNYIKVVGRHAVLYELDVLTINS